MLVDYLVGVGFLANLVEEVFEFVSDGVNFLAYFVYLRIKALLGPR